MLTTLRTLLRAGAAEAEEGVIDANGPRLLAQHLRDAEADLKRARQGLATLIARQKAEGRRRETAEAEIAKREAEAREALTADRQTLAEDLATRLMALEDEVERAVAAERELDTRVAEIRRAIAEGERRMTTLAADLRAARTGRLARGLRRDLDAGLAPAPAALDRAEALAERLNETGREADDRLEALMREPRNSGDDLDDRVETAGLSTTRSARRDALLARLKSGTQQSPRSQDRETPTDKGEN
ncbi:MAG: PspA/IM30 family protein [Pseudomonadota bacterium]